MQRKLVNWLLQSNRLIAGLICLMQNNLLRLLHPQLYRSFSINSHLTFQERVTLYKLSNKTEFVAEIGSYVGASACCFGASAIKNSKMRILCIDTWNNDSMSEGCRDTWLEFHQNTSFYSRFITPIRGFSTHVAEQVLAIAPVISLLFIDGDHSYDGVKADWDTYKYFLRPGSIIIFHDYGWAEGVKRVVKEDVMPCVGLHNCLPNMWWGEISRQP